MRTSRSAFAICILLLCAAPVRAGGLGLPSAHHGLGFGNLTDFSGIRLNIIDNGVQRVSGLNITLGVPGHNDNARYTGISLDLLGHGAGGSTGLIIAGLGVGGDNLTGVFAGGLGVGAETIAGIALSVGYLRSGALNGIGTGAYTRTQTTTGVTIGLFNSTENLRGLQIGLLNHAGNNPRGLQWLPGLNLHF